jgi:DNA mismatch endonuclease, patch repair protein
MMSGIRGKNTRPELLIRKALHALGVRYRLHDRSLPGTPDLVLPRYRAVIFIHGCFWHRHDCHLFKWPSTNVSFWQEKLTRNCEVDEQAAAGLRASGWRVLTVWECSVKGKLRRPVEQVAQEVVSWLDSGEPAGRVKGGHSC